MQEYEQRLSHLESRYEALMEDVVDLRRRIDEIHNQLRVFEAFRLEVAVYLRQVRWLIALVVAALITGLINIVLNLELHGG